MGFFLGGGVQGHLIRGYQSQGGCDVRSYGKFVGETHACSFILHKVGGMQAGGVIHAPIPCLAILEFSTYMASFPPCS